MTAIKIDGKAIANEINQELKDKIAYITNQPNNRGVMGPGLAVVMVGDNPASEVYVKQKAKACERVGILSRIIKLPHSCAEADLFHILKRLATDESIHGVIVQLPLPDHIDQKRVIDMIPPMKDVDGFHPYNVGRLAVRDPAMRPCTPYGIIKLLESTGEVYKGRHAVILGASNIVGRPMALELMLAGATVTVCHKFTDPNDMIQLTYNADILISAVGKPRMVKSDWVHEGSTLIDVGITRCEDGKLRGDFHKDVWYKAAYVTPVPGGVGPMTVAILMQNTFKAWERLTHK